MTSRVSSKGPEFLERMMRAREDRGHGPGGTDLVAGSKSQSYIRGEEGDMSVSSMCRRLKGGTY